MITYNFGDILLVPMPFTDQTDTKRRPTVVISNKIYHQTYIDIVVMSVTSQVRALSTMEVIITQWQAAGLLKPSVIKPVFTTLDRSLVIAKLGQLDTIDQRALRNTLPTIWV